MVFKGHSLKFSSGCAPNPIREAYSAPADLFTTKATTHSHLCQPLRYDSIVMLFWDYYVLDVLALRQKGALFRIFRYFQEFQTFSGVFRHFWQFSGIYRRFQEFLNFSDISRIFQAFSGVFRHFQEFLSIFRSFQAFLGFSRNFQGFRHFQGLVEIVYVPLNGGISLHFLQLVAGKTVTGGKYHIRRCIPPSGDRYHFSGDRYHVFRREIPEP